MNKKSRVLLVAAGILASFSSAAAQQPAKVWKIGMLVSSSQSLNAGRDEAFRQGLRDLGYVEGKNIIMEYRYADGKLDRLSDLADELVRAKVDVIIVGGTRVAAAAKQATNTIPIVITGAGSLVEAGIVQSFMRPGGNVTGVSRLAPDYFGKRLELIKQIVPKAFRLAALMNRDNPGYEARLKDIDLGVQALGMKLQPLAVRSSKDFEGAFKAAAKERAEALVVMPDALFHSYPSRLVELAAKDKLPAMYDRIDFVEAGGLMSYGVNLADLSRQGAWYVDQVLKGAKPSDLTLVEPTKQELAINLKTAQQIGLTIPPNVLSRADKVIK